MSNPGEQSGRGGAFNALLNFTRGVGDEFSAQLDRLLVRLDRWQNVIGFGVLITLCLAIYSYFVAGFDLSRFVTGDALYPVHMLHFPLLDFRPPPSNNIFPDVLVHALINPFVGDPLWQKMIAGWVMLGGTIVLIAAFRGGLAAMAVGAVLFLDGFGVIDSTSHYTLPLMTLLFLVAPGRILKNLVLAASVFSELLILMPLSILVLAKGEERYLPERLVIIVLAAIANIAHSEVTAVLPLFIAMAVAFWSAALVARIFSIERIMIATVPVVLLGASAFGFTEIRYVIPVAASFILLNFRISPLRMDWIAAGLPIAALVIFTTSVDGRHLNLLNAQYDCLLDVLAERDIEVIAADHWTAKPLYFAALAREQDLIITQTDFVKNENDYWMAPYDNTGAPTLYSFRSNTVCADIWDVVSFPEQNCSQDKIAPLADREAICNGLELFTYKALVPLNFLPRPNSKIESLISNVGSHLN